MEAVGLAIGLAVLPGAFTACLDCFGYIRFGRHFGQNYGTCLLRLDVARLKISRCEAAAVLGPEALPGRSITVSEKEIQLAQSLWEKITEKFENAKSMSERFAKHAATQGIGTGDLLLSDNATDMGPTYTTWEVSLRKIKEMSSEAGRDAIELIHSLSFLHRDKIPAEELFRRAWEHSKGGRRSKRKDSRLSGMLLCQSS